MPCFALMLSFMLNQYFDKICFLTQAERKDRLADCIAEMRRVGITAHPFYSIQAGQPYQSFCLSQKQMIKEFFESEGKTFLGLEDDVIFRNMTHLWEAMKELPDDWDIVYLGANVTDEKPERYSKHLRRIRSAWTTHAIGYNRKILKHILDNYKGWEENGMYDDWLSREVLPKFKCFVITPMIAWQRPVFSDLWGKNVSYGWESIENKLL